ncbi:DUF3618 domain-containing protein [Pengzhenrongella sp.]|jgi:hypothetical protein|uniref:DUF3618 domain-containing protein n=1 Tax=Pengzhenrongella sp. TaxID=2888820 RepID=UPI002F92B558
MTPTSDPNTPLPGRDSSAAEIQHGIDNTRNELAHTVDELSRKFDVKSRTRAKLQDIKQGALDTARSARESSRNMLNRVEQSTRDANGHLRLGVSVFLAITVAAIPLAIVAVRRRQR